MAGTMDQSVAQPRSHDRLWISQNVAVTSPGLTKGRKEARNGSEWKSKVLAIGWQVLSSRQAIKGKHKH